jgi:signal peptidase I
MAGMTVVRWVAGALAAAVGGALLLRSRYVAVKVDGASMEPTLHTGDWVLVHRVRIDRVQRDQIVVFEHPDRHEAGNPPWLIKRTLALPGDEVPRDQVPALRHNEERRVPPGALVVLGDNTLASFDSRQAGYFAADTLLGVVVRKLRL